MAPVAPHEFVEPESGTRDAVFGWCAREDCGFTRDAFMHAHELNDELRCRVSLIHADKSKARCVLHKDHVLTDSDHWDEHAHCAGVLVHQSTIREVQALQDARDCGELD